MPYKSTGDWRDVFANSAIVVIDEDVYDKEIRKLFPKTSAPLDPMWKPMTFKGIHVIYVRSFSPVAAAIRQKTAGTMKEWPKKKK